MTISGSYDFNPSSDELITDAYKYIGAVAVGETPTTNEYADGRFTLNTMLKGWQTRNIGLWLNQKCTLFLSYEGESYSLGATGDNFTTTSDASKTELKVAGIATDLTIDVDSISGLTTGDYIGIELDDNTIQWTTINGAPAVNTVTLTAALTGACAIDNNVYSYTSKAQRPIEIVEARSVADSGNEIPLTRISREEYMQLSDKTSTGIVTQFWYDPQLSNGKFYVWPTNIEPKTTIKMTIKKPISDFDASADTAEFPQEWIDAIVLNLAIRIAIKKGAEVDKNLKEEAKTALWMAETYDTEKASTYFQPDMGV